MFAWLAEVVCGMSGRHRDGSPSLMWDRDKKTGQRILRCPNCFKVVSWWGGKPKRKKENGGQMRTGRVVWGLDEHDNFRIGQVTMINQDSLEVKTLQGDVISLPHGRAHKVRDNQLYDYIFETIGEPLGDTSVPAPKVEGIPADNLSDHLNP